MSDNPNSLPANTAGEQTYSPEILKIADVMKQMPSILQRNELTLQTAQKVIPDFVAKCRAAPRITAEMDEEAAKKIVNARARMEEMKDRRSPFTQLMSEVSKKFPELEGSVKILISDLQEVRDRRVREVKEENARIVEEARKKREKEQEAARLEGYYFKQIGLLLSSKQTARSANITKGFNDITLENFAEYEARFNAMVVTFPANKLDEILVYPPPMFSYHTLEEAKALEKKVRDNYDFASFFKKYQQDLSELVRGYVDRLPSKLKELEDMKRAADEAAQRERERKEAEERQRLQQEAERKAKEEKDRLDRLEREEQDKQKREELRKQREEAQKKEEEARAEQERERQKQAAAEAEKQKAEAEQKRLEDERVAREREEKEREEAAARKRESDVHSAATLHQTSASALTLFHSAQAEKVMENIGQTKKGWTITVTEMAGWTSIISFWMLSEEPKKMWEKNPESLANMTLDRMKTYAENQADAQKIESPFLVYTETEKAVTRAPRNSKKTNP